MLRIGLTGGIGSGKTTVARLFEGKGIKVIDADRIAHQLVEPGQPALRTIVSRFGGSILGPNGRLNRDELRDIVFKSPERRRQLESILHPLVDEEMQHQLATAVSPYCMLCIPLLLESGRRHLVNRVLVVDCPVELQYARVKTRDNLDHAEVQRIIDSQLSREQKLAAADDVIFNAVGPEQLVPQVERLHAYYLSLSRLARGAPHRAMRR